MKAGNSRATDDAAVPAGGVGSAEGGERWQGTAIAAFFRSEARGFAPGFKIDDWLPGERELGPEFTLETASEERVAAHLESVTVIPHESPGTAARAKRPPMTA